MRMLGLLVMFALSSTAVLAQVPEPAAPAAAAWSFGGETRLQYERFTYEEWGKEPDDRSGYLLQRVMLHAGRTLGTHASALVEMKSAIEAGRVGGPRLPDEDRLDLHQGLSRCARAGRHDSRRPPGTAVRLGATGVDARPERAPEF